MVLKEERLKKGKKEKTSRSKKDRKRKNIKRSDGQDRVEAGGWWGRNYCGSIVLDSRTIGLVISLEFTRKNQFRKKKLDRPIYVRNLNGIFNHEKLIKHTVEVELFYKGHK